jgi:large subunit ribosomal protein L32e
MVGGAMNRRRITFERYGWHKKKKLSTSWRRPRGHDNKMREHIAAKGAMVKVGYRRKRSERGLHPSGVREVLVHNPAELAQTERPGSGEHLAVRIAATVGRRKRAELEAAAAERGIRVLNPALS